MTSKWLDSIRFIEDYIISPAQNITRVLYDLRLLKRLLDLRSLILIIIKELNYS